jgi:FkbM family methyltransferase
MRVLQYLKRYSPIREIARLVDVQFSQLAGIDERLRALEELRQETAENHACLLHGLSAVLTNMARIEAALDGVRAQNERLSALEELREETAENQACLLQGVSAVLANMARLEAALDGVRAHNERLSALAECREETTENHASLLLGLSAVPASMARLEVALESVRAQMVGSRGPVSPNDCHLQNPEVLLLQHLYAYLPSRNALDVGAHVGETSLPLLESGYEVYAFEPHPGSFQRLQARVGADPSFHARQVAIGAADCTADLLTAADLSRRGCYPDPTLYSSLVPHSLLDDLKFTTKIQVSVRSIASLCADGDLPAEIGLMKIDTEGYDLEVLRGTGPCRPAAVMAEFWDPSMAFSREGALYHLDDLVAEMRRRDYWWHIIFHHLGPDDPVTFYCTPPRPETNSWGNVVCFRERQLFQEALAWCTATLPRRQGMPGSPGPGTP